MLIRVIRGLLFLDIGLYTDARRQNQPHTQFKLPSFVGIDAVGIVVLFFTVFGSKMELKKPAGEVADYGGVDQIIGRRFYREFFLDQRKKIGEFHIPVSTHNQIIFDIKRKKIPVTKFKSELFTTGTGIPPAQFAVMIILVGELGLVSTVGDPGIPQFQIQTV